MAGSSSRTAAQKLGVVPGCRLGLLDAPDDWLLDGMPDDVDVRTTLRGHRDVTVAFVRTAAHLRRNARRFVRRRELRGA